MCDADLTHQERNFAIGNITDGCKMPMLDVNVSKYSNTRAQNLPATSNVSDLPLTLYSSVTCKGRSPVFLETILADVLDLARDQQEIHHLT